VKRLAREKLLCDLTLELETVGTVFGHGLSSFESPAGRSIAKQSCPAQGAHSITRSILHAEAHRSRLALHNYRRPHQAQKPLPLSPSESSH
jgi:hypothetical protein